MSEYIQVILIRIYVNYVIVVYTYLRWSASLFGMYDLASEGVFFSVS